MGAYTISGRTGGAYNVRSGSGVYRTLEDYNAARGQAAVQDRAHEINMREMQYLAAQQALGIGAGGTGGGEMGMNQWLNQWNQTLQESKGF